jgi:parvulin-like peptidyl-prolyl isomerase
MLKLLSILAFLLTLVDARMIGGIALSVDGEPITIGEIKRFQALSHLDKKRATEALIQQKLEEKEIQKEGIFVNDMEIDEAIKNIAKQNGVSVQTLKSEIAKQGLTYAQYRKNLSDRIKKDKLYKKIVAGRIKKPDDVAIKAFYNQNIQMFKTPEALKVLEYSSPAGEALARLQKNPMLNIKGIRQRELTIDPRAVNPKLLELLKKTPDSKFTPIINTGNGYVMFFMKGKIPSKTIPLESVKDKITALLMQKRQEQLLNEFFQKKKSEAVIKIVRKF